MDSNKPDKQKKDLAASKTADFLDDVVKRVVHSRDFKRIIYSAAPEIASQWACGNPLKKIAAGIAVKSIQKKFNSSKDDISSANAVLSAVDFSLKKTADLSGKEKIQVLENFINGFDAGILGKILTDIAVLVNSVHAEEPLFISEKSRENFRSFIEALDFGEIKEAVDSSGEDFTAFIKMANEEMWRYPAKMICLLSLIPSALNMTVSAVKETVKPMNEMAPDLLGDVALSLIDDINGKNIGMLINELSELIRKIHTGSALLGDPGKPKLPNTLSRLARDTMSEVDISLLLKSKSLLAEISEQSQAIFYDMLEENPELAQEYFNSHFKTVISLIRKWSRRADSFERLFSDEEISIEFSKGMSGIDAQELADTINRLCGILNRVHETHPGIIKNTLSQTINSLDSFEFGNAAKWLAEDITESVKPVASEILPPVIRGIADLIRHDQEFGSGEIKDAIEYLRSAINSNEAKE